jgi:hypothetical protein
VQLGERNILASADEVFVYGDGTVEGGAWFNVKGKTRTPTTNPTPPVAATNKAVFVKLGQSNAAVMPGTLAAKLSEEGAVIAKGWTGSRALNFKTSTGATVTGNAAEAKIFEELEGAIGNKTVLETLEDGQGRLSIVLERPGQTNQVVSVHPTSTGELKVTTFEPAYNPHLNSDIPVPVSRNRLVPDYKNTPYLHPATKGKVVRIEMKGNRNADFKAANEAGGFGSTFEIPTYTMPDGTTLKYTWHHLDDFTIINNKAYCTMQLVEKTAHGGSGITGMAHSGSVAQFKAYFNFGY